MKNIYGKIEITTDENGIICGEWFGDQDAARAFIEATLGDKVIVVEMFDEDGHAAGDNTRMGSFIAR